LTRLYKKFMELRINGVKLGVKCTIIMYGKAIQFLVAQSSLDIVY
jgi:hypothetical protein